MRRLPPILAVALAVCAVIGFAAPMHAQSQPAPDYHRADVIRTSARYVFGTGVQPRWLEDSVRFWFTSSGRQDRGVTYMVDPARAQKRQLFDNAKLAAALSIAADTLIDPTRLPRFTVVDTGRTVEMQFRKKVFRCNAASYAANRRTPSCGARSGS
jgi:hypothetical protein